VHIHAIRNDVAHVDPDAESDCPIRRGAVADRDLLLHTHSKSHRAIRTLEHHEQRITGGVDDPAAMLGNSRIDQVATERSQPLQRADVVLADQAALTHDVGMHHSSKPAPAWPPTPLRTGVR
jgi:hypothetical protein